MKDRKNVKEFPYNVVSISTPLFPLDSLLWAEFDIKISGAVAKRPICQRIF